MFEVRRYHDPGHAAPQTTKILDDARHALTAALAAFGEGVSRPILKYKISLSFMVGLISLVRVGIGVFIRPRDRRAALALDRLGYDLLNHPARQSGC